MYVYILKLNIYSAYNVFTELINGVDTVNCMSTYILNHNYVSSLLLGFFFGDFISTYGTSK